LRIVDSGRAVAASLPEKPKIPDKPTLDDAIKATSELTVGMSENNARAVLQKHGIRSSGYGGGNVGYTMSCVLSDGFVMGLDFHGSPSSSQELREVTSELIGWRVFDHDHKLLPQFSRYKNNLRGF
jgi:hypothetical protein